MPSRKRGKNPGIGKRAILIADASAIVELLWDTPTGRRLAERLQDEERHGPAHLDSEVFSALGRLRQAGMVSEQSAAQRLAPFLEMSIERHDLAGLLLGVWERRTNLRLADALYVELASQPGSVVITTDQRLARSTSLAEAIG